MVNTCFVWQRLPLYGRVRFLETNAIAAQATLIAANVGDQIRDSR